MFYLQCSATKGIIGKRIGGEYTITFERRNARGFSIFERAEAAARKVNRDMNLVGSGLEFEVVENALGRRELI